MYILTSLKWRVHRFLSTIYLVRTALPRLPLVKYTTAAAFNLIIQRPRIAGGTLTIPLDSTVKIVSGLSKDVAGNVIRLQYGPSNKNLVMRALSPSECGRWLNAIRQAVLESQQALVHETASVSSGNLLKNSKSRNVPQRTRRTQRIRQNEVDHAYSTTNPPQNPDTTTNCAANLSTASSISSRREHHEPPSLLKTPSPAQQTESPQQSSSAKSLRRMLRRNAPDVMQLFTIAGQIIAAAT
ncbi:unnamed protein product [Phytophthora fragariaefolia]|uniref:Unnamed protein product n=1 Tax=Phytophthora fragariaefolia TaxID=1490495 RepID=A0A9W6TVU0_9STRA|nr:unnamed protein product [Phytophthora fragariaefolia]